MSSEVRIDWSFSPLIVQYLDTEFVEKISGHIMEKLRYCYNIGRKP